MKCFNKSVISSALLGAEDDVWESHLIWGGFFFFFNCCKTYENFVKFFKTQNSFP